MTDTRAPFHNPFASLARLRGDRPADPAPPAGEPPAAAAPARSDPPSRVPRAVVRIERRGRAGKAVTVVDHLNLDAADREAWLTALKAALGCGGAVEDDALVLQGDHRARVPALLTARGVKRVTLA